MVSKPVLVVEDDVWLRVIGVVLDPTTSPERFAAFAVFMSPDEPNFQSWCDGLRQAARSIYPADVRLVSSTAEMRANLAEAAALVTESLAVSSDELELAPRLKAVHKYGTIFRDIDVAACKRRGIKVLGVRRRANIACAEHAFALMLMLARRLNRVAGLISGEQLAAAGFGCKPFDSGHTPRANWGRIPGMRTLNGETIGIIGFGEIGREIASRAVAFGMRVLYFQRTRLSAAEEDTLRVSFQPLDALLAQSDWVVPQLPSDRSTSGLINRAQFALMKPGAVLVNVSRAEVVDREALLEALGSGRLGGFALDPLYEEPGRSDDELLGFKNVVLTPHLGASPRTNGLKDIADIVKGLAQAASA
jgi:phosphoglycerate dehydrogenase-like enzyme